MKSLINSILLLLFLFSIVTPQISGVKYIPGDFTSVKQAIDTLNARGVGSGGVVYNINAGHYEKNSGMILTASGTASNRIIFKKYGTGNNPLITANAGSGIRDGILILSGSDYVSIDGLDFKDTVSANQMEWGIAILKSDASNGSNNVTVRNCNIILSSGYTSGTGIYINNHTPGNTTALTITTAGGTNSGIKIYNNYITNSYTGIYLKGYNHTSSPYNLLDQNNEIGKADSGNVIAKYGGSSVQTWGIYTIYQNNLIVSGNTITSDTTAETLDGIYCGAASNANTEITFNTVSVTNKASTNQTSGIRNLSGANGTNNTVRISNNLIQNCTNNSASSGSLYLILNDNSAKAKNLIIQDNEIKNNVLSGTGALFGIEAFSPENVTISGNIIRDNQKTGASGTLYCIKSVPTGSLSCYNNTVYNNTVPNTSGGAQTKLYGYFHDNTGTTLKTESVYNNNFYSLTIGGSASALGVITALYSNTYSNTSCVKSIFNNTLRDLTASNTNGATIIAIYKYGGDSVKIYKNNIYNLSTSGTNAQVQGIVSDLGLRTYVYNNFVSELKTPQGNNNISVIGVLINGGATDSTGLYYNTIYLNSVSLGVNFGAVACSTSAAPFIDMRNNIFINLSIPTGSGKSIALKRSGVTLTNYQTNSDRNCFYSGTPSSSNIIFNDGTNSYQTLTDFKTRVSPRETNSISGLPDFVNTTSSPYDLHLSSTSSPVKSLGRSVNNPIIIDKDYDEVKRGLISTSSGADEYIQKLNLKVLIQGLYNHQQNLSVSDTLTVISRLSTAPYLVKDSVIAVLNSNGISEIDFRELENGNSYYLTVRNKGSLESWSGYPVLCSNNALEFDFTTAASQCYGNNQVLMGTKWCLYNGDANNDGQISLADLLLVDADNQNFISGYSVTDVNGDGQVNLDDLLIVDGNNQNFIGVIKP